MITVFVTGAGGGVGQGIIKSLKLVEDLDIRIISADMSPLATALYKTDCSYLIPKASDDGYTDFLVNIFKKEKVDFYFPGTDVELLISSEQSDFFRKESNTTVVVSPYNSIEIADDKYLTYKFISENNLPAPESYLPDELPADLKYPIIVKPRVGCRSIGVSIANNEKELQARLSTESGLMVQELVGRDDEEYTCTVASYDGQISEALILRRTLRSGDTYRATPVKSEAISNYVRKLTKLLNINGSCNFQLRLTNDVPKVFEINCRFSGTTPFCSQLGFNPVEFYLKSALGKTYESSVDYNKIVLRHWTESVIDNTEIEKLSAEGKLYPSDHKISTL
ncbi:MAG: hypothetical protein BM556_08940 [Bacteriovorax sp. MedPE-SWde]|nr:MAG: hypothetical protein BM556_08940 [Bacteriovorax sp. MedPE-SWde]